RRSHGSFGVISNGGPNGIRTRVSALRGPCPGPLDDGAGQTRRARRTQRTQAPKPYTKFVGWGRRIRTPATWSRATRPTTRRSPTNAPNLTIANSANRGLEGAARAEARHLGGRNLNLLAGARVAAVAGGAARDDERAEAGDRDATAAAERLDDAADEGVHGAL